MSAHRYPPPGRLVSAGSYSIHVDCRGTGSPPVVFESGNGGTSLDWTLVQPRIARTTRACSYDRAGFGWSDAAPVHTLERMRHDFELVLAEAGPGPYVLVAHSFGGLLVLDYAARHPDRVAGLVLVDAADKPTYEVMRKLFPSFESNGRKAAVLTRAASVLTRFGVTRLLNQPAAPKTVAPSVRSAYRALGFAPKAYRAFADDLDAFPSYVDAAEDRPPSVPAAVLTHDDPGSMWRGVPAAEAERTWQEEQRALATRLGADHQIVHSDHFIQVLQPDAVTQAIERVVAAARGSVASD